jgi:hypothetical protein
MRERRPRPAQEDGSISFFNSTLARRVFVASCVLLMAAGCASSAWKQALREDTAVSYHRFLREYPSSKHAAAAQERIDFLKLEREPSLEAFEAFREKYPNTELVDRLRGPLEKATFEGARATGTPTAYSEFAAAFPDSDYAARAEGNAIYLREVVNQPDPNLLREFALAHPESDFAAEAKRSADVFEARRRGIGSVGLVVAVSPDAPEARRVVQAFVERAKETYSLAGTRLVPLASRLDAPSAGVDALLIVNHAEKRVDNVMQEGLLPQAGVLATTRVRLARGSRNIFERVFELRADERSYTEGKSVLFGSGGPRFWADFFVPVSTWEVDRAVREPVELAADAVAVDASGDRAVVLFPNGAFEVLQLADPTSPVKLAGYDRETQLENFDGVRVLPSAVAIYGEDGFELVGITADGRQSVVTRTRGEVGSVTALEALGDRLVIAGAKGLQVLPGSGEGESELVMRRALRGMARAADLLVLADGDTLFVSTLPLLREKRVMGQIKIGKAFATGRIRVFGTIAVVIGEGGVMVVDMRSPRTLRMIGRLRPDRVGQIADAGRVGSRIFLVGDRGIQVLGPKLDRVVEVVDAVPGRRIAAFGRHLVAVGGQRLQVVDGLPFGQARGAPARPER